MAASSNGCRIAIGCEDGCVRLFKITCLNQAGNLMMTAGSSSAPLLEYVKTFDKADARILSICWNSQDTAVIVGTSDGNIRTLDATSGRVIQRISVDSKSRSNTQQPLVKLPTKKKPAVEREMLVDDDDEEDDKKNVSNRKQTKGDDEEETLVWAVQALQDGKTIVSGDSLGHVCFWDAQSGTLRQLIKAHLADVLCLAANKEGTIVYSSGVDRVIVQHRQVPTKLSSSTSSSSLKMMKWIPAVQRRYHSHDVRALALNPSTDMLVSGGVDTTLIVSTPASKFDHVKQRRMPLWPTVQGTGGVGGGRQTVSFVKEMRWMVEHCRDGLGIRVWTLGTGTP